MSIKPQKSIVWNGKCEYLEEVEHDADEEADDPADERLEPDVPPLLKGGGVVEVEVEVEGMNGGGSVSYIDIHIPRPTTY